MKIHSIFFRIMICQKKKIEADGGPLRFFEVGLVVA